MIKNIHTLFFLCSHLYRDKHLNELVQIIKGKLETENCIKNYSSYQKYSYVVFFQGGISKHQADFNHNNSHVNFFTFWILKGQLLFIGSVKRQMASRLEVILTLYP